MRGALLLVMIFASLIPTVMNPFAGVLVCNWIAFMNPHQLVYGIPEGFPVQEPLAIATILVWIFSREPKVPQAHPLSVLLVAYYLWTCVTTLFAVLPDQALTKWVFFSKVFLIVYIAMCMMNTKARIHAMLWITVLSVGYFGVKGGIFTILTGGGERVYGPPSLLGDNNQLAVGLLMIAPLMLYLRSTLTDKRLRLGMAIAFFLILVSVLGSASRGAIIGIAGMLVWLALQSKNKMGWLVFGFIFMASAWSVMPDSWRARMSTIQSSEEGHRDQSSQTRLNMWTYAYRIANERPITGGGFNTFFDKGLQDRLLPPGAERDRAVHSIWFEVLGEHGYVGLALWLTMAGYAIFAGSSIRRKVRNRPDLRWCADLGSMLSVSTVGYCTGGAFVNIATLDVYYTLVTISMAASMYANRALKETSRLELQAATVPRAPAPWAGRAIEAK